MNARLQYALRESIVYCSSVQYSQKLKAFWHFTPKSMYRFYVPVVPIFQ